MNPDLTKILCFFMTLYLIYSFNQITVRLMGGINSPVRGIFALGAFFPCGNWIVSMTLLIDVSIISLPFHFHISILKYG